MVNSSCTWGSYALPVWDLLMVPLLSCITADKVGQIASKFRALIAVQARGTLSELNSDWSMLE